MKKILLSMALVAMGVAANAQCYVIGEAAGNSGWAPNEGVEIPATNDADIYSGPIEITGNGYFAIANALTETADDWATLNSEYRFGPEVKDTEIVLGETTPMIHGIDASWKLTPGNYIFTVDFNENTLVVTEAVAPGACSLEVIFDDVKVENGTTVVCNQLNMEKSYFDDEPDWNEATIEPHVVITNISDRAVTFTTTRTVVSQQEESIFSWCMGNQCINADIIKGETLEAGQSYTGVQAHFQYTAANPEDGQNPLYGKSEWVITLTNDNDANDTISFNLVFDYNENSAGVNDIEIDNNAPAEYYNFQGVKVDNPQKGLYIVKRGNKVTKEFVK